MKRENLNLAVTANHGHKTPTTYFYSLKNGLTYLKQRGSILFSLYQDEKTEFSANKYPILKRVYVCFETVLSPIQANRGSFSCESKRMHITAANNCVLHE